MTTRNFAAVLLVLNLFVTSADAVALPASLDVVLTGVSTFDGALQPGPNVDVYHFTVSNPNAADATSLSLSFTGNFVNNNPGGLTFSQNGPNLPAIATFTFGETFFVLPPGQILAINTVDNNSQLSSEFTMAGSTALVPAGGSAVVAVLSVPTGTIPDYNFFAEAVVDGIVECVGGACIPEPTSAVLCAFAMAGYVLCRR